LANEFPKKRIFPSFKISIEKPTKQLYKSSLYSAPGISPLKKYSQR
jgi:hypothetical protein